MPIWGFGTRTPNKTQKKKSTPSAKRRAARRGGTAGSGNVADRNESAEAKRRRLEAAIRRFKRLKG